jgi:hypothetical protein
MSSARLYARLPHAVALAVAALLGACEPLEQLETAGAPEAPPGEPPPAGFASEMIDAHAAVRADPTTVGGSPMPSPPLDPLAWSSTVTAAAQAWADGCRYMHNPALGSLAYGENIAATAGRTYTAAEIVGLWASEAPFYDYASITCDEANPANEAGTCGHYTQLVWRATTVVGCGVRTCTTGSPFGSFSTWTFWVCDYAPPGNVNVTTQRPY